jgi:hypothetical protein
MTQAISLNVFKPIDAKGDVVGKVGGHRFEAKVATAETGTLVPGTVVKLADTAGAMKDVLIAAAADDAFGVVQYEAVKKNGYVAGEHLTIASLGTEITMEASAAIARGAKVEYVPTGAKVATLTTGKAIGIATTKAAANGDLIKVLILVPNTDIAAST